MSATEDICARCRQPLAGDEPCIEWSNGTFTHIVCVLATTAVPRPNGPPKRSLAESLLASIYPELVE